MKIDELARATSTIVLNPELLASALQGGFRRIVTELGKSVAQFNVLSNLKSIVIRGSAEDAAKARAILLDGQNNFVDKKNQERIEDKDMCAVCWCEATNPYTVLCGHTYCQECFINQCSSARDGGIPVKCFGAAGTGGRTFTLADLSTALSSELFTILLESSFAL